MPRLSRRKLLLGSLPVLGLGSAAVHNAVPHSHPWDADAQAANGHNGHAPSHGIGDGHASFRDGRTVDHRANGFDPHEILRDFDWGKTRRLASGRVLREWTLNAVDREIEVMPGVRFAAWTYNGR